MPSVVIMRMSFAQMFPLLILVLYLNLPTSKALESEQCVDMGGRLSTISFKTEIHEIPAGFWSVGMDKSKGILETILTKIKSYEQNSDTKWIDVLRENFAHANGNTFLEINEGEIWTDDKTGMSIKMQKGSFCAVLDSFKSPATELSFTCEESEQLYGIGYHKVYESCKNDPFISKFAVDWGVCLHGHYPWVDMLNSNICVMKSYNNDFIACFCSLENGVLHKRGFCITKFECLMNGQGVEQSRFQELEVGQECINNIQYFLEANTNGNNWFKNAQKKDNLRVRAPYHSDSPCREFPFSARFDIGQLDLGNIEAQIEVYTPFVEDLFLDNDLKDEEEYQDDNMSCMLDISTEHKVRMDILSFFFEERMIANIAIWIPGILFVYSSIFEERGRTMRIIVSIIQLLISSIGIYNIGISFLPDSYYSSIPDVRQIQMAVFGSVVLLTQVFINYKEVAEHFLTVSIINFIPDIVFWKMIMVMYTEHRMNNYKIIIGVYFLIVMSYTMFKLRYIMSNIYLNRKNANQTVQDGMKRTNSKNKKERLKSQRSTHEDNKQTKTGLDKSRTKVKNLAEDIFPIVCQWRCSNVLNIGYISINCSEKCYNQYHNQCWDYYRSFNSIENEKSLLGKNCLTGVCCGKIYEIVWVDKFGIETPKKYILTELEKIRVGNRKKMKTKKPKKIARSLSETSGSSIEEISSRKAQNMNQEKHFIDKEMVDKSPQKPRQERIEIPYKAIPIQTNKSYASTVRNINTPDGTTIENVAILFSKQTTQNYMVDSLHNSPLVNELLGQNCPESFDSDCKLPQKSKILSLIRENSHSDYSFKGSVGEIGDHIETEIVRKPDLEMNLPSGFIFDTANYIVAENIDSKSVVFVPGAKEEQFAKNVLKPTVSEGKVMHKNPSKMKMNETIVKKDKPDTINIGEVSPLAKILFKQVSGYSLHEVDSAVNVILKVVKLEDLTIPTFRNMLIAQLANKSVWEEGVYMSEDDDEEGSTISDTEECLICTELLEENLHHLEPCGHVFHLACIKKWVRKDSSCPKCRVEVQL